MEAPQSAFEPALFAKSHVKTGCSRCVWIVPGRVSLEVAAFTHEVHALAKTQAFIITRSVSEGFSEKLRKGTNAIPRWRVGLG